MKNTFAAPVTVATLTATVRTSSRGVVSEKLRAVTLWKGALGFGIRIEGTPGSWYLSTLTEKATISDDACIDMGQAWYATGVRAAVIEALNLIVSGKVS